MALKKLNPLYNPTLKAIVEFALVGGTMKDHDNAMTFQDAWHHSDENEKKLESSNR